MHRCLYSWELINNFCFVNPHYCGSQLAAFAIIRILLGGWYGLMTQRAPYLSYKQMQKYTERRYVLSNTSQVIFKLLNFCNDFPFIVLVTHVTRNMYLKVYFGGLKDPSYHFVDFGYLIKEINGKHDHGSLIWGVPPIPKTRNWIMR